MKKLLILLGSITLIFTLAAAEGKCNTDSNSTKTETKCDNGKSDSSKKIPEKGKCGQGKCGD